MFSIFKKTTLTKTAFFVVADVLLIAFSVWFAFFVRFEGQIPDQYDPLIIRLIALTIIFTVPIFYFQKLYSFSWSYVSANEAISLLKATTVSFIFLSITIYISRYFPYFNNFPRSTLFISYILVLVLTGGLRFSKRMYLHAKNIGRSSNKERTLIVGAGDAAEQIARNIISTRTSPYFPVGFVDDNPIKRGIKIHGLKVLGRISDIPSVVKSHRVKQLIIAIPSANNSLIKKAVELGREAGLYKIKITPSLSEIIKGQVSFKNLKELDVGDLLGREPVVPDRSQIETFIKGRTVLITGAAGSIGSELSRQTAKFKPSAMVLLDQDETGVFNVSKELKFKFPDLEINSVVADVRDSERINEIFKAHHPQIVFHAAAYKHVPLMEENPQEAVKNNIFGTQVLAEASLNNNLGSLIFISTDKAVNPTSVMGATKRVGEIICRSYNNKSNTKFVSVRFGNVLDSRGSVIPAFREQIKRGGPVEVTHPEMKRYFMLTSEACLLVMQAGAMGQGGEVFVLDMRSPIKIVDLAKEMIRLYGLRPDKDIAIVFSGVRPGEKLFEEILTAEEGTVATRNQKIFVAKLSPINIDLNKHLSLLKEAVKKANKEEIVKILKNIVPSYHSGK